MSTNRLRRRNSMPPLLLLGLSAAVMFAAGVGIAVLVDGVDGTPHWMRTTAIGIALGLVYTFVAAWTKWALDQRTMKRICRNIDAHRFHDAAGDLQVYVKHLEKLCGPDEPLTLRWTYTLAHVLLHNGQRMRAMALLALVIDSQLSVLGPSHPDTLRSLLLLGQHTDTTVPIASIDAWWR